MPNITGGIMQAAESRHVAEVNCAGVLVQHLDAANGERGTGEASSGSDIEL